MTFTFNLSQFVRPSLSRIAENVKFLAISDVHIALFLRCCTSLAGANLGTGG